jgi:8-oxo-dGTP pyrophosphatase MutT (NUDIX family)
MSANNAAVIFITSNDRIIFVRDAKDKKWMVPGGCREKSESDFECALREFREETSFNIEPEFFIKPVESILLTHRNYKTTRLYIIHSNQTFLNYDTNKVLNKETDKLFYLKIDDLKDIINQTQHPVINKIKDYNLKSLKYLVNKNLI